MEKIAQLIRRSALVDPPSPAPSSPTGLESTSSASQGRDEQLLPSPEKELPLFHFLHESKWPLKKPAKKKGTEPNPESWTKPESMEEEEVHALDSHRLRILNETKNVSSFVVIGQTLHKLYYEDKLMKTQKEFLEWTKAHLGFSKSTTYEYIISYRIYSDIAEKLDKDFRPPMYQSHCQLLSKVPPKKLVDTWQDVCQQAPNGIITTAFLEQYLEKNQLKIPKSRIASNRDEAHGEAKSSVQGASGSSEAGPSNSSETPAATTEEPSKNTRKNGRGVKSPRANDRSKLGKHAREDSDKPRASNRRRKTDTPKAPSPRPLTNGMATVTFPVTVPPPVYPTAEENNLPEEDARPRLPFNDGFIFELSKNVVAHQQFDMVMQTVTDFKSAEQQPWLGRLWCNLSAIRPFSTTQIYGHPANHGASYEGGLERLLEVIFTKFANKEFVEGLFLLRAEFGADWFTPILQHPYCILRHNNPPMPTGEEEEGSTEPGLASTQQVPYESYVMFYLGPNIKDFCTVFRSVGLVPGINSWAAVLNLSNVPGLFIPTPAPAPDTIEDDEHTTPPAVAEVQDPLSEAASALVEIAGISGTANGHPVASGNHPRAIVVGPAQRIGPVTGDRAEEEEVHGDSD
ncbi:hypothetical protein HKX48_007356 [Thoreauomyces humboldtii]|nr:hypothetical protein HKX48_007356 [Thoreauomyces humboldtii]